MGPGSMTAVEYEPEGAPEEAGPAQDPRLRAAQLVGGPIDPPPPPPPPPNFLPPLLLPYEVLSLVRLMGSPRGSRSRDLALPGAWKAA